MTGQISIYDTTLHDFLRLDGVSLSTDQKLELVRRLDHLGLAYIEVGSVDQQEGQPDDFFQELGTIQLENARTAVVGNLAELPRQPDQNLALQALVDAGTLVCTLIGTVQLPADQTGGRMEYLRAIENGVAFLKSQGREVIFGAQDFFASYKMDPHYPLQVLQSAVQGGADVLVMCDTQCSILPWEVARITSELRNTLPGAILGIRPREASGCAVANVVAAVGQGVLHVQGSISGYEGRQGIGNLLNIIPDLELKMGQNCLPPGNLPKLVDLSQYLATEYLLAFDRHMPYVGRSTFTPM